MAILVIGLLLIGRSGRTASAEEAANGKVDGEVTISATVVDATTGKAIEKFRVVPAPVYKGPAHLTWQSHLIKRVDHGKFEWRWRPYDQSRIRIDAPGYRPFISEPFTHAAGEIHFDLKLQPDSGIVGKVLKPDGTPAADAQVALCTWTCEVSVEDGKLRLAGHGARLASIAKTADDGTFSLPAEIDKWVLVAAGESGYVEVTATELQKSPILQLKAWGRLELKYAPGGKALAEQSFSVGSGRGDVEVMLHRYQSAKTDADGRFVLDRVPPVRLYVQPIFPMGDNSTGSLLGFSGDVTIEPGRTLRMIFPRPGQTAAGRIALPVDTNLTVADFEYDVSVSLNPPSFSGDMQWINKSYQAYNAFMSSDAGSAFQQSKIPVNEKGEFQIAGLPEAQYMLYVRATEKRAHADDAGRRPLEGWHAGRITVPPRPVSAESVNLGQIGLELREQKPQPEVDGKP